MPTIICWSRVSWHQMLNLSWSIVILKILLKCKSGLYHQQVQLRTNYLATKDLQKARKSLEISGKIRVPNSRVSKISWSTAHSSKKDSSTTFYPKIITVCLVLALLLTYLLKIQIIRAILTVFCLQSCQKYTTMASLFLCANSSTLTDRLQLLAWNLNCLTIQILRVKYLLLLPRSAL